MRQCFSEPYEPFGRDISVKLDLSNHATKADFKNATGIDTSKLFVKSDLASLKVEMDKLDIKKLVPVPVDLSKLSDVVKNDVVKKTVYDKLVAKVNNMGISGFVLKTKYDTDKTNLEKKISDVDKKYMIIVEFLIKIDYNTKITDLKSKTSSTIGLTTSSALTAVENKIPDVSSLVKKTDYNTKISKTEKKLTDHNHDNYITTKEFIVETN